MSDTKVDSVRIAFGVENYCNNKNHNYILLANFLLNYQIKGDEISNIIDQGCLKSYNIPPNVIGIFYNLYNNCVKDNLKLCFSEKQGIVKDDVSGIYIDIDIKQNSSDNIFNKHVITDVMTSIVNTILLLIQPVDEKRSMYVMATNKPNILYNNEGGYFKDGYHIILPSMLFNKQFKRHLIKILNKTVLPKLLENLEGFNNLDIIDPNSSSVVALLVGSSKCSSVPYNILTKMEYVIRNNNIINKKEMVKTDNLNIPYEFSLNIYNDQTLPRYRISVIENKSPLVSYVDIVDDKEEENFICSNVNIEQVYIYINILSPERLRYRYWFRIMCGLVKFGLRTKLLPQSKKLALYFSKKRPKGLRPDFEKVWDNFVNKRYEYPFTEEIVKNYARQDNILEYNKVRINEPIPYITEILFSKNSIGHLGQYNLGVILHMLASMAFVIDQQRKEIFMYEMISEIREGLHEGHLFKYKRIFNKNMLLDIVSKEIPLILDAFIDSIKLKISEIKNEEKKIEGMNKLITKAQKCRFMLTEHNYKTKVVEESLTLFAKGDFSKRIDKETDILGVINGVLKISDKLEHTTKEHPYNISRYCSAKYTAFDINNEYIVAVCNLLYNIYPCNQLDCLEKLLFHVSQCLNNRIPLNPRVLLLIGTGANGKTVFSELLHETIGDITNGGYCTINNINYLTTVQNPNAATNGFVVLLDARLVIWTEGSEGTVFDATIFKKLIASTEDFPVRANFGDTEKAPPRIHLVISNHPPATPDTERASTRRVEVCHNPITFTSHPDPNNPLERLANPDMVNRIIRSIEHRSAFLSILLLYNQYLKHFYKYNTLNIPSPNVTEQTRKYLNSFDKIGQFINENIVKTDEKYEYPVDDFVDNYISWYIKNIKEEKFDKSIIKKKLNNSVIGSYISCKNRQWYIRSHRFLLYGEEKRDDEEYLEIRNIETITKRYTFPSFMEHMNEMNTYVLKQQKL